MTHTDGHLAPPRPPQPDSPALGAARALFWVQTVHFVLGVAAMILAPMLVDYAADLFENPQTVPVALAIVGALAFAITIPALHLVSLVLAIIVTVRGRSLVRTGAIVILVALVGAVGLTVSFSVSGELGGAAERIEQAVDILEYALAALELIAQAVGIVLLRIGIGRAGRR